MAVVPPLSAGSVQQIDRYSTLSPATAPLHWEEHLNENAPVLDEMVRDHSIFLHDPTIGIIAFNSIARVEVWFGLLGRV